MACAPCRSSRGGTCTQGQKLPALVWLSLWRQSVAQLRGVAACDSACLSKCCQAWLLFWCETPSCLAGGIALVQTCAARNSPEGASCSVASKVALCFDHAWVAVCPLPTVQAGLCFDTIGSLTNSRTGDSHSCVASLPGRDHQADPLHVAWQFASRLVPGDLLLARRVTYFRLAQRRRPKHGQ